MLGRGFDFDDISHVKEKLFALQKTYVRPLPAYNEIISISMKIAILKMTVC